MANIINKGTNFGEGDTVTAANLNNHVDNATFVTGPGNTTDDSTLEVHADGYLKIKDGGITSEKLASDAISGNDTIVINNNNFTSNSISGDKLVNSSVTSTQLATSAVTTNKIANGSITSNKFASGITIPASSHTHANATTSSGGFMSNADKSKLDGIQSGATAGGNFPSNWTKVTAFVGFNNDDSNVVHTTGTAPNYYTGPPCTHWFQHGNVVYFDHYHQILSSSAFLQSGYTKSNTRYFGVRLSADASMPVPSGGFKFGTTITQATCFSFSTEHLYSSSQQYQLCVNVQSQLYSGWGMTSGAITTSTRPQPCLSFTAYPVNSSASSLHFSEFGIRSGDPFRVSGWYFTGGVAT